MSHTFYRPAPPLDALVEYVWATDSYPAATPRERVLPTGSLSLVFHLGDQPVRVSDAPAHELSSVGGAVLCGARTSPLLLDTSALGATVGVQFKPGGVRPFLDGGAEEVAERAVALEALWGPGVRSMRERLLEELSLHGRTQLVEQFLVQRAQPRLEPQPALRGALAAFEERDLPAVSEVNRRTGLSPKRLLALFREHVGLSPKAYWRVRRFRSALEALESGKARGARLAAHHGYCDQAHYLREFRALAGSCPSDYLALRVPGSDHVSVRD